MIGRSAGHLGLDTVEPKLSKIEFVHKDVDHPNWIVLADPVPSVGNSVLCRDPCPQRSVSSDPRKWRGNHLAENHFK